jgi:aminopeptidase N
MRRRLAGYVAVCASLISVAPNLAWATTARAAPAHHRQVAEKPRPGAPGVGDRLFPLLGNGGYDVLHYDLGLRYATDDPAQPIDGSEVLVARATQALSRFDLDFSGAEVSGIAVNGHPATFTRQGQELVITPRSPLPDHHLFVVSIRHFRSIPTEPDVDPAFFVTPDGSATAPQPDEAHLVYPSNDHPSDKATFTFAFNVPAGTKAVANGVEIAHRVRGTREYWTYSMRQPMATELTQLAVGHWDFGPLRTLAGVPMRDVTAPSLTASLQPALAFDGPQMRYMQERVGRYPFDIFGTFVPNSDLGFALETQTISLIDEAWFADYPQGVWEPTMLHELSHMWFGDSVSPEKWSDLWLNEGHASWYEFVYAEQHGELAADTENYPDPVGYATLDELMRAVYAHGDQWRQDDGPVARPTSAATLFSLQVYHGGALALYALRQKVGDAAFQRIERAWVKTYEGKSVSTDDFIALASRVSGRNVTRFLRNWLYGTTTPPMPGHPDWTVDPVVANTAAAKANLAGASRPLS